MTSAIIAAARVAVFIVVSASAILSIYAATDAISVATDVSVFWSGIIVLCVAVAIGPLFCFIAAYGLVEYLDRPVWLAVVVTAPALIAWCAAFLRTLVGLVR